jgi:hypothetical protein
MEIFIGILVLAAYYGPAFAGVLIGVVYFAKAPKESGIVLRLLSSAFGPSLTLLFFAAACGAAYYRDRPTEFRAYLWLQLLPLSLLIISIARYPGPRRVHYLCVPLGLLAWHWMRITVQSLFGVD